MSNVNMSLPKSNFIGNFSNYVFDKCWFWQICDLLSDSWHRDIKYGKKILN